MALDGAEELKQAANATQESPRCSFEAAANDAMLNTCSNINRMRRAQVQATLCRSRRQDSDKKPCL